MMESVPGFIILKFILWIFPSWKIEDVSAGIRAILDLRTRPLGPNTSIIANHPVCCRVIVANTCFPFYALNSEAN